jgi:RNA polymerase sigma-70 factor (ECF subfamily)
MREDTFDELVRRHAGAVSAYARAMTRDRWEAEEAVQETFLRAWQYLHTFDDRGSFEGWLIRICRNRIIDLAQRNARHEHPVSEVADLPVPPDHRGELHDLLDRLPLPQREVLLLCGAFGYDYDAAASILDVPVGTVRSRLHRARQGLSALLDDTEASRPTRLRGSA